MKKALLTGAAAIVTLTVNPAFAQDATSASANDIVVTGSRIVKDGNSMPTPVTVVTTSELQASTPSNIPDALRKLPVFQNSRNAATVGNPGSNSVGNFLNLRGFGVSRTLVLFDSKRVPGTNADGTVDTNLLPQLLMSRVDVVTGGASAVYGSDAVTGVVNFVLDKEFKGLRGVAQSGISSRGDNASWRIGAAYGTDLFDGRGHLEFSAEQFHSDGLGDKFQRSAGRKVYSQEGAGTTANPFHLVSNARVNYASFGGYILSGVLADQQFATNGILSPFNHGSPTGTGGVESGGDGAYAAGSSITAALETKQAFGRFDFDVTPDVNFYVQANAAQSKNSSNFFPFGLFFTTIDAQNAFLSADIRSQLAAAGEQSFVFSRFVTTEKPVTVTAKTRNIDATAGLTGSMGAFNWDAFYTHGYTKQTVSAVRNANLGRQAAALDAVRDPATGNIVCRVTLTNPGVYPGCVPLNPFGPSTDVGASAAYIRGVTQFDLVSKLDDFGLSLAGTAFNTWAGPVKMALSGEYRRLSQRTISSDQPTATADCTGLRYNCVPGGTPMWLGNTVADAYAKQNIGEVALEVDVPLLTDSAIARSLSVNGAARYTHYSTSGSVTTWKAGLDWHITDELRFRATRSRDIRAPSLYELFAPINQSRTGFSDIHTGTSGTVDVITSGNPDLKPEKADTLTIGAIYRPSWLPGFSLTIDYYNIKINNAITTIGGNNAASLAQCEASGGTSPLCDLYVRPLPFSDRTAANYPTAIYTRGLNVAKNTTKGVDAEMNYVFDVGNNGNVDLRLLGSYQPKLNTLQFTGTPIINNAGVAAQSGADGVAKWRATFTATYSTENWGITVLERWRSSLKQSGNSLLVFADPKVPAVAYTDLTLTFKPNKGSNAELFFSAENLFDKKAPVYISTAFSGNPNFYYPAANGDDVIGRYMTAGVRLKF